MRTFRRLLAAAMTAALALFAATAAYAQQGGTVSGLNLSGDKPIQIESDRLEVRDNDNVAVFSGNVTVVQGETLMRTGRMTVHYAGGGGGATQSSNIDRIEVDGKVYVKSNTQVATADRGTFDMRTETITLFGDEVVLTEGENVIVGCKLTVLMRTGEATLDGCDEEGAPGRVKMLLQPGSQGAPGGAGTAPNP